MLKIEHGIYTGDILINRVDASYIPLPLKIRKYLKEKYDKFKKPVEFTVGEDPEAHILVVSVCHPLDIFSKKTGERIVKGRINRALGFIKNSVFSLKKTIVNGKEIYSRKKDEDGNPILLYMWTRLMYDPIPNWLYMLEK